MDDSLADFKQRVAGRDHLPRAPNISCSPLRVKIDVEFMDNPVSNIEDGTQPLEVDTDIPRLESKGRRGTR